MHLKETSRSHKHQPTILLTYPHSAHETWRD